MEEVLVGSAGGLTPGGTGLVSETVSLRKSSMNSVPVLLELNLYFLSVDSFESICLAPLDLTGQNFPAPGLGFTSESSLKFKCPAATRTRKPNNSDLNQHGCHSGGKTFGLLLMSLKFFGSC